MFANLVYYGNDTLHGIAEEVKNIDQKTIDLIDTMFNIMYRSKGIGLAAPQVEVGKRIIVIDIEDVDGTKPFALINPVIGDTSRKTIPYEEGCLSLPGIHMDVVRPSEILVRGVMADGKEIEVEAGGMLARVLQHEIDHLNGILFIDHLEDYVKKELTSALKKIRKMNSFI